MSFVWENILCDTVWFHGCSSSALQGSRSIGVTVWSIGMTLLSVLSSQLRSMLRQYITMSLTDTEEPHEMGMCMSTGACVIDLCVESVYARVWVCVAWCACARIPCKSLSERRVSRLCVRERNKYSVCEREERDRERGEGGRKWVVQFWIVNHLHKSQLLIQYELSWLTWSGSCTAKYQ